MIIPQISNHKQILNPKSKIPSSLETENWILDIVWILMIVICNFFKPIRSIRNLPAKAGFTLVEVLVTLALMMALTVGLISLTQLSVRASDSSQLRVEATSVLDATMEATMAVRASNFSNIKSGTFHPEIVNDKWELVTGSQMVGNITRWVEIETIQREVSCGGERICPIVESGGVVDPVTFRARTYVSWEDQGTTRQEELESLLTFWR
jgi:hypothetical protein